MEKGEKNTLPCGAVVTVAHISAFRHRDRGGLIGFEIKSDDDALMVEVPGSSGRYKSVASVKLNFYGQNIRTLINILERAYSTMQTKREAAEWPSDPTA